MTSAWSGIHVVIFEEIFSGCRAPLPKVLKACIRIGDALKAAPNLLAGTIEQFDIELGQLQHLTISIPGACVFDVLRAWARVLPLRGPRWSNVTEIKVRKGRPQ